MSRFSQTPTKCTIIYKRNMLFVSSETPESTDQQSTMPPCLYICCHFEISDDHHGTPSRPKATSRAIQDGRRISRRHFQYRERQPPRERQRESPRAGAQRRHSHHRSRSSSVLIPSKITIDHILVLIHTTRGPAIIQSTHLPPLLPMKPRHTTCKTNPQQTKSLHSANASKKKMLATPKTSIPSKRNSTPNTPATPPAQKGFALALLI